MYCRALSILVTLLLLGGCATAATQFTCGLFPNSGCQPVSQAYEETNGELEDYDYRGELFSDDQAHALPVEPPAAVKTASPVPKLGTVDAIKPPAVGQPIFSSPHILRVLITPWEDSAKDFHGGGFVYLLIEDGQWQWRN